MPWVGPRTVIRILSDLTCLMFGKFKLSRQFGAGKIHLGLPTVAAVHAKPRMVHGVPQGSTRYSKVDNNTAMLVFGV